ncbi:uncharacterized protein LOC135682410 isoform X3 [Rhopilema esculentum]|uniref:uncharacterized protein LOC135682410 isoform X3 n=1 Tax=Rhopilema esculentum TaxID=499914 RepID=UPI0031D64539
MDRLVTLKTTTLIAFILALVKTSFCFGAGMNRPYPTAEYYWPLNEHWSNNGLLDKVKSVRGEVHGAKLTKNERIGGAVSFSGNMEWIEFPTERISQCVANPLRCMYGISIAFWIRFKRGKFILSTGGFTNSSKGTGIQITYSDSTKRYKVLVREISHYWEVSTMAFHNTWCHMVIKWHIKKGLHLFLDEKLVASDKGGKAADPQFKLLWIKRMFTIGRPPTLTQKGFGQFDMAHLAIWLYYLTDNQASQTGGLVLSNSKLDGSLLTCIKKNASCSSHPCGWDCHNKYPDAVCPEIEHKICKAVTKSHKTSDKKVSSNPSPSPAVQEKIGDIYRTAVHYFNVKTSPKPTFTDFVGRGTVNLPPGKEINFSETEQLGRAIHFNGRDDCVLIDGKKFECIKDPTTCEKAGFTMAFWIRNRANKKQYIAYNRNAYNPSGTGFMIYNGEFAKNFTVTVKTATQQWEVIMHRMPFKEDWWHFLLTWSQKSGLSLYVNGHFAIQKEMPQNVPYKPSSYQSINGQILIGCTGAGKSFIQALEEHGYFDFGHFAVWEKVFNLSEVRAAYKASIKETEETRECCKRKKGHDCVALPCRKFKEPHNCAHTFGSRNCICKKSLQPIGKCRIVTPLTSCRDNPKYDCKRLASQTGYCNYFQVEMERHCPASCHLCDGLYRNAAHYFKIDANSFVDYFAKSRTTIFPKELNLEKTTQLGHVLSLNGQDYYVNIKGFQRECITDPNVCQSGLTVAFWLQMFSGKYVISGGQYRDEPRGSGFIIFHDANSSQFRISLATVQNKWSAVLHKVPFMRQWFHLAFTWSQRFGLRVFVNGRFVLQDAGATERKYALHSTYEDNGIFIGGKDSSESGHSQVRFNIGHISAWDYPLDARGIFLAYKETIAKNAYSLKCCKEFSGNKCVANACYKFRAPERCNAFFRSNKCLCPDQLMSEKCESHVFKGQCKDSRPDCKDLKAQQGYCQFYQQDMERLCPATCGFCDVDSVLPKIENSHGQENGTKILPEASKSSDFIESLATRAIMSHFFHKNLTNGDKQIIDAMQKRADDSQMTNNSSNSFPLLKNKVSTEIEGENDTINDEKASANSIVSKSPHLGKMKSGKLSKEVLIFSLIGCAAGIILLFLISLYSWKVYRSKFTGAFVPGFKAVSAIEVDEYGDEKWTKKYIDSSYFVIKDVPPKKRALPIIPSKPTQPKYHPPDFQ